MRRRHRIAVRPMIDAIAELWAQDKALSEIGLELGKTRSSVAGLIQRARRRGDPRLALGCLGPG